MKWILLFLVLIVSIPSRTITIEQVQAKTVQEKITTNAQQYGVDPKIMSGTIKCESRYDNDVIGDGGKARGIAQFHRKTFDWMKGLSGMKDLKYESEEDQILLMAWAFANGYARHWTCYRLIKSGKYIIQL